MIFPKTIAEFIKTEENRYETQPIDVLPNVSWNMRNHIVMSISMKYGWFTKASNDYVTKPFFKKIILPIMRVKYAARDIDVKDILLYVDDPAKDYLSFLVKKFYDDIFVIENNLDEFIDKAIEQQEDLGGTLIKKGEKSMPEVQPLDSIAFCDQSDVLSAPVGFKFNYSPDSLRKMSKLGWGDKSKGATAAIEEIIKEAIQEKDSSLADNKQNKSTGKAIEVYVVRGEMPEFYLKKDGKEEVKNQVQIVAFYTVKGKTGTQILYRAPETEEVYKFYKSSAEEIPGRALSLGGIEELIDVQVWTNFSEVAKMNMLKYASKTVHWTDDTTYTNKQKIKELENGEITTVEKGSQIGLVPTGSPNIQLFTQVLQELDNHARGLGGTLDPFPEGNATSGVPLGVVERIVTERRAPHKREQGKFAKFLEEIYRDWIIPAMVKEMFKGKEWFSELSYEELDWLIERVACNQASKQNIEQVLNGETPTPYEELKQQIKDSYLKNGNRQLLGILEGELRGKAIKVKINIAGKQKDIQFMSTALTNVFRAYSSNPALAQDPMARQMLHQLVEWAGLRPLGTAPQPTNQLQANAQPNAPQATGQRTQQVAPVVAG